MNEIRVTLPVPREHPSYAGHFPGQPIVPGVVLLDLVLQALHEHAPAATGDGLQIPVCKFVQAVRPGAVLELSLQPAASAGLWNFRLQQSHQLVASGSLRTGPAP